jgi:hypothetical protein
MLGKIYNHINYQVIFFLVSIFLVFTSINLFYLSSEAPDYIFYKDYFDYFFRETTSTGRENGLLYFFLISCIVKTQEINITPATELHYISNSIHVINFLLYIVGLTGLYKLLELKKFEKKNILLSFIILNFMPFTIKLLSTMKPEILAFAILPWSLLCIELFIKYKNINYIFLSIFPNIILLSTKNSIVASIGAIYLFIVIVNFKTFKNIKFLRAILVFSFFYFLLLYEDFSSNGYLIINHMPEGGRLLIPEGERVKLNFIYNINFYDLIQKPYRHNHANSFIGMALLDLFGDYFQWYANNTKSLYSFDNYTIKGFWYFGNVKELVGLFLGIITYFFIFRLIFKIKDIRLYLSLPFFSYLVFLLNIFIRRQYFDTSRAELFKSHYYSYLFVITFAFLLVCVLKNKSFYKYIFLIFLVLTSFFMHGFFKTTYTNTLDYLSVKNNVSQFCDTNKLIFDIEGTNECDSYFTNLCEPDILLFDLRYLVNSSDIVHTNYPLELSNEAGYIVKVNNSSDCLDYAKKGFRFKSIYMNKVRIPWINLVYLIFSIFSLYQINKMFRNEIDTN